MAVTKVKASVLHGTRDLRLVSTHHASKPYALEFPLTVTQEERQLPPLGPDDIQVTVKSTGLCGSDLHYFNHFRNGDILVREPLTLGHESAGVVSAVGSQVKSLQVGDHVALEVGQPCEQCELCSSGRYNICREMKFRSSAKAYPHAQGTLQEQIIHPAKWSHKYVPYTLQNTYLTSFYSHPGRLPPTVSLELGALVEPLSVALHASDRARLSKGSTVLVFGAGTVGLLCAAISKVVTESRVVIADIQEERVKFAVENGFADAAVVVPMKRPETVEERLAFAREVAEGVKAARFEESGEVVGEVAATYECTGVEGCLQASIYVSDP